MVEYDASDELFGNIDEVLERFLNAGNNRERVRIAALLENREIDGRLPIHANNIGLDGLCIDGFPDVRDHYRGLADGFERHRIDHAGGGNLGVGVEVVVVGADLDVARGKNEVAFVDLADHVHWAELVGLELERIDVNHDLAVLAAKRLGNRCARDVRDLVADVVLAQIVQLRFVKALALKGNEANRETRCVEFQNDRWERARGQAAQVGHGEIGDGAEVRVGVCAGLKVDFDEADPGQGTRLDVIHAAREREKALKGIGDIGFDLLRGHAGIEGGDHNDRDIDRRKQVDGHANERDRADDGDHQAANDDEKGVANRKTGHQLAPLSVLGTETSLAWTFWPARNWLRLPITTRSCVVRPERTSTMVLP